MKKLSNTEAELKKIFVYKNMRVNAVDFCREKLHLECLTVSIECSLPINIFYVSLLKIFYLERKHVMPEYTRILEFIFRGDVIG